MQRLLSYKAFAGLVFCLALFCHVHADTTFVSKGSSWKYLDDGSNQDTAWRYPGFNDNSWNTGPAELGYGDGDEATVVGFGGNAANKYITTYFRKNFTITDTSLFNDFRVNIWRDDGSVIYINGKEVYRSNMPAAPGVIQYKTKASATTNDDGKILHSRFISRSFFSPGTNLLAVEVHQVDSASSDVSFDLELIGRNILRGPYLQSGTPSTMMVCWKTFQPEDSKVKYGLTPGNLADSVTDPAISADHKIKISGLLPDTKYYYSVGSGTTILERGTDNYFITSPPPGAERKIRIWATGDCGTNTNVQKSVKDQYLAYEGNTPTDVWLLLGDNAYTYGYDSEYQSKFFEVYNRDILKRAVLWPAPGNHDYANDTTRQKDKNVPYYDIFEVPQNGEAGGMPSGTESYYSFDYGNVHFLSLDSYGKDSATYRLYDTLSPQVKWVKSDLAANTQRWTIVYWHHPPYAMGTHNSDTENELVKIRSNFIQILERYKVDLILCGHSHAYERTRLMKGHYGLENTFNASTHNLSSSSAKYDGSASSCPYIKNTSGSSEGTVYVVSGSAGKVETKNYAAYPHNAMYFSDTTRGGSFAIDVDHNRLDAKFVCEDGVIRDRFTIMKDVNKNTTQTIPSGDTATLAASWEGQYIWSPVSGSTKTIRELPSTDTSYYQVNDNYGCLSDTITLIVVMKANILSSGNVTCQGDSNGFAIGGAAGGKPPYTYTWNTQPMQSTASISGLKEGTYQVTVTDSLGAASSASVVIAYVHPLPSTFLLTTDSVSFCQGGSLVLKAASGFTGYAWSGGATTDSLVVSQPGVRYLTVTNAGGCDATDSVTVSMHTLPNVTLSAFSAVCISTPAFALGGGSPAGGTFTGTGVINNQFDPMSAGVGTHLLTYFYEDTLTHCSDTAQNSIVVDPCSSIKETDAVQSLRIFPNPSSGILNIDFFTTDLYLVRIQDAGGKEIYLEKPGRFSGRYRKIWDLKKHPKGMYFIQIITDKGMINEKILLQ